MRRDGNLDGFGWGEGGRDFERGGDMSPLGGVFFWGILFFVFLLHICLLIFR